MLPFFLHSRPEITPVNAFWLLATGLIPGFLAITFAVAAQSHLTTATFDTPTYFEPVAMVFFGWFLFRENLSGLQLTDCVTIMASGCAKALLASRTATP